MTAAYVGLGSNLGDRLGHLRFAARALAASPGLAISARSRVYETEPVGGPAGQGPYLNAVVRLESALSARDLLKCLLEVERARGRERRERWGPRTLDLDLLVYGPERLGEPGLTVPHPRIEGRAFVLAPLADLDLALEVPGTGRTVADLLVEADRSGLRLTELEL